VGAIDLGCLSFRDGMLIVRREDLHRRNDEIVAKAGGKLGECRSEREIR
jgi:hypothetical protein